jgi:hypothetical protein
VSEVVESNFFRFEITPFLCCTSVLCKSMFVLEENDHACILVKFCKFTAFVL